MCVRQNLVFRAIFESVSDDKYFLRAVFSFSSPCTSGFNDSGKITRCYFENDVEGVGDSNGDSVDIKGVGGNGKATWESAMGAMNAIIEPCDIKYKYDEGSSDIPFVLIPTIEL